MKKILTFLSVLFFSASCFSLEYNGDIQLHIGLNFNKSRSFSGAFGKSSSVDNLFASKEFNIDLESWNFLKVNDTIDLGLMASVDVGFGTVTDITTTGTFNLLSTIPSIKKENLGKSYHLNLLFGPALGYKINQFFRLNMSLGFSVLVNQSYQHLLPNEKTWISVDGIGFGANIQTKFMPNNTFSPLCGCRFTSNFFDNFLFKSYPKYSDPSEYKIPVKTGNQISTEIYFGFAYNF